MRFNAANIIKIRITGANTVQQGSAFAGYPYLPFLKILSRFLVYPRRGGEGRLFPKRKQLNACPKERTGTKTKDTGTGRKGFRMQAHMIAPK